ncbi:restriction endonuclease subunit S [Campylobacter helveticus]|uniref:restriction endonuclease subunit S n=1 Tax=Campylobacter helveticus TaxID=28898 RepID=UPI0022EB1CAF|nr:restriction endonuclease subunit S [Campylobacter helveticus]
MFNQRNEQNNNLKFQTILSLVKDVGVIPYEEKGNVGNKAKDDLQGYKIARVNDLVLNKMNAVIGSLGVSKYDGLVSPIYLVLYIENPNYLIAYYSYLFQTKSIQKFLRKFAYGIMEIRESIDYLEFKKMFLPTPPLQEQKEIAEFLDSKCEKIQNYIEKKQKLITLLQEKKQALINEAVTKGLNPNIESKNSGIEYLGLIPHHWEVKKLKYVGKVVLGKMLCNEYQKGYSHCYYLKSKNLQWLNVEVSQVEKMWFSEYEKSLYRIKKDDLLVSEGGEVGKTCIWNNELAECYIQNSVHKITLNKFNNAKFFLYAFFAYGKLGVFDSVVSRVSIAHLVLEKLINVDMVVPPLQEQKEIAEFLDKKCEKINSAIEKTKKQIELVKEYKNTLINEAVCGRINLERK